MLGALATSFAGCTCETARAALTHAACSGIDEAGRGPVLGPMVYGAAFCAVSNKARLARMDYADSKTLTEEKREALFGKLKADATMGWAVDSISAQTLSVKMLRKCAPQLSQWHAFALFRSPLRRRRERYNLNAISYDSAYGLIQARVISHARCARRACALAPLRLRCLPLLRFRRRCVRNTQAALDAGVNLTEIYVDTVGDAGQYTQRCARLRLQRRAVFALRR